MFTVISQNSKGFIFPKSFVESVILKDGAVKITEPSKYPNNNTTVVLIYEEDQERLYLVEKPRDYHVFKQNPRRKSWFNYESAQKIKADQDF